MFIKNMTIVLAYEHRDGGSNSADLLTSWYYFKEKSWKFR